MDAAAFEREVFVAAATRLAQFDKQHFRLRDAALSLAPVADGTAIDAILGKANVFKDSLLRDTGVKIKDAFSEPVQSPLDRHWVNVPSPVAALSMDLLAEGPADTETLYRALTVFHDVVRSSDPVAPKLIDALGPIRELITAPLTDNLSKIGLATTAINRLNDFAQGRATATAVGLDMLREEVSKHLPTDFGPILSLGTALLAGSGPSLQSVVGTVIGARNDILGLQSMLGQAVGAIGPGVAVQGAIAAGMAIYGVVKGAEDNRAIREALDSIKQDVQALRLDVAELKNDVLELRSEFRSFATETFRNFERAFATLDKGFAAVLQDTQRIRRQLNDIESDLRGIIASLARVEKLQQLQLDLTLTSFRQLQTDVFRNKWLDATDIFSRPLTVLDRTSPFGMTFISTLNFFYTYATQTSFNTSMSRGTGLDRKLSLFQARAVIADEPSLEMMIGLIPEVIPHVGRLPGWTDEPAGLPRPGGLPRGIPNPVEFVRGADAFVQLYLLAPLEFRAEPEIVKRVEDLRVIAERLVRFCIALQRDYSPSEAVRQSSHRTPLYSLVADAKSTYLSSNRVPDSYAQEDYPGYLINYPLRICNPVDSTGHETIFLTASTSAFGSRSSLFVLARRGYSSHWSTFSSFGEGVLHSVGLNTPGSQINDVLHYAESLGLLTISSAGTIDSRRIKGRLAWYYRPPGGGGSWYDDKPAEFFDSPVSKLSLNYNNVQTVVLAVSYATGIGRANFIVAGDDVTSIAEAPTRAIEFLEELCTAIRGWHARHWSGITRAIRRKLEADPDETLVTMEAEAQIDWLIDRLRFHNVRHKLDNVITWFADADEGGPCRTKADVLKRLDRSSRLDKTHFELGPDVRSSVEPPASLVTGAFPVVEACAARLRGLTDLLREVPSSRAFSGVGLVIEDPIDLGEPDVQPPLSALAETKRSVAGSDFHLGAATLLSANATPMATVAVLGSQPQLGRRYYHVMQPGGNWLVFRKIVVDGFAEPLFFDQLLNPLKPVKNDFGEVLLAPVEGDRGVILGVDARIGQPLFGVRGS